MNMKFAKWCHQCGQEYRESCEQRGHPVFVIIEVAELRATLERLFDDSRDGFDDGDGYFDHTYYDVDSWLDAHELGKIFKS